MRERDETEKIVLHFTHRLTDTNAQHTLQIIHDTHSELQVLNEKRRTFFVRSFVRFMCATKEKSEIGRDADTRP